MNRLGLKLTSKNLTAGTVTENPVEIPIVGQDLGPGGGQIYHQSGETNTELNVREASGLYSLTSDLEIAIKNSFVDNNSTLNTWENVLNNFDFTNGGELVESFFESNENENFTYLNNSNEFELLHLYSNDSESNSIIGNWFNYFKNDIIEIINAAGTLEHILFFYKYTNVEDSTTYLKALKVTLATNSETELVFDLSSSITGEYLNVPYANYYSATKLLPVISRTFTIQIDPNTSYLQYVPASLEVFPQPEITELDVDFVANYNGVTAQSLPNIVNRYRPLIEIKNAIPLTIEYNSVRATQKNPSENTKLLSFSTSNRQIIVKFVYLNNYKPVAPWFDRNANEILTLECKIKCYGSAYSAFSAIYSELNIFIQVEENLNDRGITGAQGTYQGQPIYYSERRFRIDVSDLQFVELIPNDTGGLIAETYTVLDKAYTGAANTYKAMIFEISDITIKSNQRVGKTPLISYSQTGLVTVPTFKGGDFTLGRDMSGFINNSNEDFFNNSLIPSAEKLDSQVLFGYEFSQFTGEEFSLQAFTIHPIFNNWATYPFEFRTGAINSNYEVINLSDTAKAITVGINISITVAYANIVFKLRKIITTTMGEEIESTILIEESILKGDSRTLTAITPNILASNQILKFEMYADVAPNQTLGPNFFALSGEISGTPLASSLPTIPKSKIRPRFNYY